MRNRGKRFLILCEGQTERLYFQAFRNFGVEILPRDPSSDPVRLLQDALTAQEYEDYDQIWLVFDLDFVPSQGIGQFEIFSRVIRDATKAGIRVAYSVDAFELWFCLHYAYTEQRHNRAFYYEQLSNHWGINYASVGKKKRFAAGIRQRLIDDPNASEEEALKRAKKLFEKFSGELFRDRNPITTVFQLVREITRP
ncbi:RloB family protein [Neolewinella antarctica]|uniref:RloB domain-containing protein n=1 Tax=Neolewinella antarctica TaxID=442734 RepID=A0ABX0XGU0_9BACT|nr:RloB family protein [Neolewinella antarctica]NJC28093.1 hypothetical protein [Neolewinella antarctica]